MTDHKKIADTSDQIVKLEAKLTALRQMKQVQNDELVARLEPMAETMGSLADTAHNIVQEVEAGTDSEQAAESLRDSLMNAQGAFNEAMTRLQNVSQQMREQGLNEHKVTDTKPLTRSSVLQHYHIGWLVAIAGVGFLVGLSVGLGLWLDVSEQHKKSLQEIRSLRSDSDLLEHVLYRLYPKLTDEQRAELDVVYQRQGQP